MDLVPAKVCFNPFLNFHWNWLWARTLRPSGLIRGWSFYHVVRGGAPEPIGTGIDMDGRPIMYTAYESHMKLYQSGLLARRAWIEFRWPEGAVVLHDIL